MIMTTGNLGTAYPGETSGLDKPYLAFGELLGPGTNISPSLALAHYLLCVTIWNLPFHSSWNLCHPCFEIYKQQLALWYLLLDSWTCNNSYLFICPTPHPLSPDTPDRQKASRPVLPILCFFVNLLWLSRGFSRGLNPEPRTCKAQLYCTSERRQP